MKNSLRQFFTALNNIVNTVAGVMGTLLVMTIAVIYGIYGALQLGSNFFIGGLAGFILFLILFFTRKEKIKYFSLFFIPLFITFLHLADNSDTAIIEHDEVKEPKRFYRNFFALAFYVIGMILLLGALIFQSQSLWLSSAVLVIGFTISSLFTYEEIYNWLNAK